MGIQRLWFSVSDQVSLLLSSIMASEETDFKPGSEQIDIIEVP